MRASKWILGVVVPGLMVPGILVAGCDVLQSPARPSGTADSRPPDLALGNSVLSPQQGQESVDWRRFTSSPAGRGQINALPLSAAAVAPGAPSNLTFTTASSTVSLSS